MGVSPSGSFTKGTGNKRGTDIDLFISLSKLYPHFMRLLSIAVLAGALALAAPKKPVQPKEMPTGRPFSPGILSGNTLYIAGQTGADVKTGKYPESFEDEVKQTLENINLVLKEAGMTFDNAV